MIRYVLPCLLPFAAMAQTPPEAMLDFAEGHCLRHEAPSAFYDLPDGWREASDRLLRAWLPTLAIEEGIDYAAFITYQTDVSGEVDPEKAAPLTLAKYEAQLMDERSYALDYRWTRLFVHRETGAFLYVSAGDDVDDIEELNEPTCYLWHPDADHPLNAAIIARWDVPFGHRFVSYLGQATFAWNNMTINGESRVIETRVIRPNTDFAAGLAPVVLKFQVTGW